MRIDCFDVRPDERASFALVADELGAELALHPEELSADTIGLIGEGVEAVSVLGRSRLDDSLLAQLAERGVKYVATRSIGYDNVDVGAAARYGIRVSNSAYAPDGVAEFTVMMILMALRRLKAIRMRANVQDYSLVGACGRELGRSTVGVIGTGRIGATVARLVSCFGATVIAYDVREDPALAGVVEYVSFEELLRRSDVITLHAPLLEDNHHMLDAAAFAQMKDGVCLVNCSRGELVDTDALIDAIESGRVGAASVDVIEHDLEHFHQDLRHDVIRNRQLALLRSFPDVLLTPHVAFYTDRAVEDMVRNAAESLVSLATRGESALEVTPT